MPGAEVILVHAAAVATLANHIGRDPRHVAIRSRDCHWRSDTDLLNVVADQAERVVATGVRPRAAVTSASLRDAAASGADLAIATKGTLCARRSAVDWGDNGGQTAATAIGLGRATLARALVVKSAVGAVLHVAAHERAARRPGNANVVTRSLRDDGRAFGGPLSEAAASWRRHHEAAAQLLAADAERFVVVVDLEEMGLAARQGGTMGGREQTTAAPLRGRHGDDARNERAAIDLHPAVGVAGDRDVGGRSSKRVSSGAAQDPPRLAHVDPPSVSPRTRATAGTNGYSRPNVVAKGSKHEPHCRSVSYRRPPASRISNATNTRSNNRSAPLVPIHGAGKIAW